MPNLPEITLKKDEDKRILSGHPWIYDNEIEKFPDNFQNGGIILVKNSPGRYVGLGYLNKKSKIAVRLIEIFPNNRDKDMEINLDEILRQKITIALKKRGHIKNTNAKRLVFSEADSLPGLTVDLYANILVLQITTLGMEKLKEKIIPLLDELVKPEFIYEKSISPVREKEGLEKEERLIKPENGKIKPIIINENKIRFIVDIAGGSKTGFYLDQRENREKLKEYVKGRKVLDVFCYTGGFSVYALRYGAQGTTGIDISEEAVEKAKENMELNNFKNYSFVTADAFDKLRELDNAGEKFGVIILDPPAFSKSKDEKEGAIKGYKDLHLSAFRILEKGGVLLTFSCSQNISKEDLLKIARDAAKDTRTQYEVDGFLSQSSDHPYTKNIPETLYLKGIIIKKR